MMCQNKEYPFLLAPASHCIGIVLDVQKAIFAKIEEEQALVAANRRLIELFEQKIKTRIAAVWETKA